ncbi:MAG: alpha/beta hydrolase [Bacteroidota bacterium]
MLQRLFLLVMFSLAAHNSEAQANLTHYYVKIDGAKEANFELEFGKLKYDEKYAPKRVEDESINSLDNLLFAIFTSLCEENTSDKLNILIHGIWADKKFAWEQMVKNLSRDTYANQDGKQKVILSIIWDSSFDYKKGVRIARLKGDYLSTFLKDLIEKNNAQYKINFLCHSMGNRVFQHMINESDLIEKGEVIIDQFVSVGADIESNAFEEGEPLHGLHTIINDITIYIHNNDRTLGMSKLLNSRKRLGLNGVPDISKLPENMRIIDVSVITDHDDLTSKIGNHRYFYTSPSVRKDLGRVLWNKDFSTSKKELKYKNSLKLLPDDQDKTSKE